MRTVQTILSVVCFLTITGLAEEAAQVEEQYGGTCQCISPPSIRGHYGDPANTCPTFCYVDCTSSCWDLKPAKGRGRCWSEAACKPGPWNGQCVEDSSVRLLDFSIRDSGRNSPRRCIEKCSKKGFLFAGVQYSNQCFCGDREPHRSSFVPAGQCNSPCPGDENQFCGGTWKMNVYSTDLYKELPPQLDSQLTVE